MKSMEYVESVGTGKKVARLTNLLAEIKIRFDRGNALIYWIRTIFIGIIGIKLFIPDLSFLGTAILGVVISVLIFIVGLIDIHYLKLYQTEANLNYTKYNPWAQRIEKNTNETKHSKKRKKVRI